MDDNEHYSSDTEDDDPKDPDWHPDEEMDVDLSEE